MTETELFKEGLNLMFSGMGFVITFLLILIWAIGIVSKLINTFFPEPIPVAQAKKTVTPTQSAVVDDIERLRPVIVAAIAHHRRTQGLN
ncbi:oxaloacetate decarboxylase subunit gamma [Basfia succiniciproducens]|uniref:Probable oxaloacetate decarboxylase gamma chain n=1 Tax=Basfia succiniciproducens TaxID=653940 RepID=A0A1G5CQ55_9PAST|nr:oxaloacetate decarboxylase subunit gamma [Basfia succiniciproducens]QIM69518.1 oxaloacetate decarboxylase gamma chain [Basfia succiniciproducens]SCY04605.1 oxaloacetate decarboxylase, gamma subunit [Basfia succiniciproducens]SEQ16597.1 oxaloacetate decarboxylase, gamma subunit [Basfia succiniciproducens]